MFVFFYDIFTKPLNFLFMADIYKILLKHFLNETSKTEEKQIAEFKRKNFTEYKILFQLWEKNDIEITDFNSTKAWKQVQLKVNANKTKVIPIYTKLIRIAAVAAILIIGTFSVYYFSETNNNKNRIEIASNEKGQEILLADGSVVWLNKGAVLSYPKTFDKNTRNVELTGEAFFEIQKNPEKPFIINTSNAIVEVLGTSFNVNSNTTVTNITVATGKVSISNSENSVTKIISPGYSAIVNKQVVKKYKTEDPNYLSWKTGIFIFDGSEIKNVVDDLNTYYKTQIEISKTANTECSLTADFKQAKLKEILEIIKLSCDINYRAEHNKYIIY